MRVAIVINSLVQGGAQRACVWLSKALNDRGHEVTMLTFYPEESDFFSTDDALVIKRFTRGRERTWKVFEGSEVSVFARRLIRLPFRILTRVTTRTNDWLALRREVSGGNFDVVLVFESYTSIYAILFLVGIRIPIIAAERVHPAMHRLPRLLSLLRTIVYRSPKVSVCAQDASIESYIRSNYGAKRTFIVPNSVPIPKSMVEQSHDQSPGNPLNVVCMARYHHQKGIDVLLRAWKVVEADAGNDVVLNVYGDGDRSEYLELLQALNLKRAVLHPAIHDTTEVYQEADIFVLPTRYEGFSNALTEAMAHGIPCITTNSPGANWSITEGGTSAKLLEVDDVEELAQSLLGLIRAPTQREYLGKLGRQSIDRYSEERIAGVWESTLESASAAFSEKH